MALDALGQLVVASKEYCVVGLASPVIGTDRVTLVFGDRNDAKLVVQCSRIFNRNDFLGAILAAGNLVWAALAHTHDQSQIASLRFRPVRVATTANGTLSTAFENGDTVDGVVLATGDRILLKNQTTATENGIYTVNASGAPTRAIDAAVGTNLASHVVWVEQGTVNKQKAFVCTNTSITIGVTAIAFAAFKDTLGLGSLASQSDLDVSQLVDGTVGGAADDGCILYWRSGTLRSSDPPPGSNYAPYWDGSKISWMSVSP